MRTLLIFVDGLGIGTRGAHNPLDRLGSAASPLAVFTDEDPPTLPHDGLLAPTDACLGIEGRPQSASGQTTILTGINAPALLGYHKQGFPNAAMREIIREHSIFLQLQRAGIAPNTFANAYTPRFFQTRPRWVSATTVAVEAAGMSFRRLEDLQRGEAVFYDFTNELAIEAGLDVQPRTPPQAAAALAALAAAHRFTLYEYFITDRVGHAQDMEGALRVISNLAAFVRGVLDCVDLSETTVVLTSDHGNVEDLSLRNHTRNLVPTLAWGARRAEVQRRVRTLADITPAIIATLTAKEATHA
jgi:hypothetical protein